MVSRYIRDPAVHLKEKKKITILSEGYRCWPAPLFLQFYFFSFFEARVICSTYPWAGPHVHANGVCTMAPALNVLGKVLSETDIATALTAAAAAAAADADEDDVD